MHTNQRSPKTPAQETAVSDAIRLCSKCGVGIPADAPGNACPGCLLESGLTVLISENESRPAQIPGQDTTSSERFAHLAGEFGDYVLLEEIGRGGQGIVYVARQKSLNRIVALKVLGPGQWASRAHLKRFRLEASAAAGLDHPGIVPIYEVGERDGSCYFSMKFVEGGQLDEVVGRTPMPVRQAAEVIAKISRTVQYAHEHGILHRDIKPGNILLDSKGEPHLTDFGLARLLASESTVTRTREVMGTPSYMAPEQAAGKNDELTRATDVYGIGAVFYHLLTGHPPFSGETTYETIRLVLQTDPRDPHFLNSKVDRDLSTICLKCLEKDPGRRYSSASALAEDLEHWLRHEPIEAKRTSFLTHGRKWVQRNPAIAALVASLIALATVVAWNVWKSDVTGRLSAKSVAVLPFSNLSKQAENAFVADGVHDEILTNLARIADLKVIGRTSVMQYKSEGTRDLRKIGQELGVAHVLEGTVQRAGNRLRVNAQLVDAHTGTVAWAEQYDRNVNDLFAVQSDIAQKVARQLQIEISPSEKLAIERSPTTDLAAFDLYTRAKKLFSTPSYDVSSKATLLDAENLLNQAIARDPSFYEAYCLLAFVHDASFFFGYDRTPTRLGMAEQAVETASRLRPDAGETHLARAWNFYWGHLDYNAALAELEIANRSLPNNPQLLFLTGLVQRRQGHWEESTRTFERAADLDPRNFPGDLSVLQNLSGNYATLGRYPEQKAWLGHILSLQPDDAAMKAILASVDLEASANTQPLHQLIDSLRATENAKAALPNIVQWWFLCAIAERDYSAAQDALSTAANNPIDFGNDIYPNRAFLDGIIARLTNDNAKARSAFTVARAEQEKTLQADPEFAPTWCLLGLIDAALGRKEDALREGRRAVELLPVDKDAVRGPVMIKYLAMIAAWVGDNELACEQLAIAVRPPRTVTYGQLKLLPYWDSLRGSPCFEQIVASLAPATLVEGKLGKSAAAPASAN